MPPLRNALTETVQTLPPHLMRSLTWEQGIEILDAVATELNSHPRKTLDWETPAERLHNLLAA